MYGTGTIEGAPEIPLGAWKAHELVERALHGEHPEIPQELRDDDDFKKGIGHELARLLYREQDSEAEQVEEYLQVPHSVLGSDEVHTAALWMLRHLETTFAEKLPDILRLMRVFDLTEHDVLDEYRNLLPKHTERSAEGEFRKAA